MNQEPKIKNLNEANQVGGGNSILGESTPWPLEIEVDEELFPFSNGDLSVGWLLDMTWELGEGKGKYARM